MQPKLRKYQDDLRTSGLGVIAFGIWSVIKMVLTFLLVPEYWQQLKTIAGPSLDILIYVFVIGSLIAIEIGIRLLIGLSARSEGNGGKKRNLYIAADIILMLISAASIVAVAVLPGEASFIERAASIIFEGSSFFVMLRLLISVYKVRSLAKKTA